MSVQCCVCIESIERAVNAKAKELISPSAVELWCGHHICSTCATKASEAGHRRCPLCRTPHLLDTELLQLKAARFRADYRSWRRGGCKGSKLEVSDISAYHGWRLDVHLDQVKDSDHSEVYNGYAGILWRLRDSVDAASCEPATGSGFSLPSDDKSCKGEMLNSVAEDSAHESMASSFSIDAFSMHIWCYWHEGTPSDLVLRCINSMRLQNPAWRVHLINKDTVQDFLSPSDWPMGCTKDHALARVNDIRFESSTDDSFFESVQKLSNWIRLTLLYKFGGVWMDASCFCTAPLETWVTDMTKVTLFSVRVNADIYENWAIASPSSKHPTIKLWLDELAAAHASTKPGTSPLEYIDAALGIQAVRERWKPNTAQASELPYLWCHLALQVALHKHPEAHKTLSVLDSGDGPMHRRDKYAPLADFELGNAIAFDLASLSFDDHDRYFIKFVGHDRGAIEARLTARNFSLGSALDYICSTYPRPVYFGVPNLASDRPILLSLLQELGSRRVGNCENALQHEDEYMPKSMPSPREQEVN